MKCVLWIVVAVALIAGCGEEMKRGDQKSAETSKDVDSSTNVDPVGQRLIDLRKDVIEIQRKQRAREFRGLPIGIPIGNGMLRISIPQDDEGGDLVTPDQVIEAVTDQYFRNRAAANKQEGDSPLSPRYPGGQSRENKERK